MEGRGGKTVDRIPSYDAVVSDEDALLGLGVCNFFFPKAGCSFVDDRMRASERSCPDSA